MSPRITSKTLLNQAKIKICDNCYLHPVTKNPKCFATWCHRCDSSLWSTRPQRMILNTDIQVTNIHHGNF